jgi:hypothetical protein
MSDVLTSGVATLASPQFQPGAAPDAQPCPTCGGGAPPLPPSYVYAIGTIFPRIPQLSVEKEIAQVIGRSEAGSLTDRQALHRILSQPANRYLVRQLCWVMTIEGQETYILVPRASVDYDLLVESLRITPKATDADVVIGMKGPIAAPGWCNGLTVPIVSFEQIYSFDVDAMLDALPCPEGVESKQFKAVAEEVFRRITLIADNRGDTDEQRALNYLLVRYPGLYTAVANAQLSNASLSAVRTHPAGISGARRIIEVVLSFTNRATDVVEKSFVRVDVSEQFPFLTTKLMPYFDR